MKTWADVAGIVPPATSVDRDAGEGPPRCCNRRLVAADALICYDALAPERRAALVARWPHLEGVTPLFLCDGCSEWITRERVMTREARMRDFGESQEIVDKARDLDLQPSHLEALIEDRLRALGE